MSITPTAYIRPQTKQAFSFPPLFSRRDKDKPVRLEDLRGEEYEKALQNFIGPQDILNVTSGKAKLPPVNDFLRSVEEAARRRKNLPDYVLKEKPQDTVQTFEVRHLGHFPDGHDYAIWPSAAFNLFNQYSRKYGRRGILARLLGGDKGITIDTPIDLQYVAKFLDEQNVNRDEDAELFENTADTDDPEDLWASDKRRKNYSAMSFFGDYNLYNVPPTVDEFFKKYQKVLKLEPFTDKHIQAGKELAKKILISGIANGRINDIDDIQKITQSFFDHDNFEWYVDPAEEEIIKSLNLPPEDAKKVLLAAKYYLSQRAYLAGINYRYNSKLRNFFRKLRGKEPLGGDPERHRKIISEYLARHK